MNGRMIIGYEERRIFGADTPEEDLTHGDPIRLVRPLIPRLATAPPRSVNGFGLPPPADATPKYEDEQPKLCPDPGLDRGGGRKDFDLLYQQ